MARGRAQHAPTPRARSRDAAGTRRALQAAGAALFAQRGFAGATALRIAARAGVNKAMINYHFGGKRGLYTAIMRDSFSALLAGWRDIVASRRSAPDKLCEFMAMFAATVAESPDLPAMMVREVLSGGEHLDREMFGFITSILASVRAVVDQGVGDGSFRPVDPLLTHLSIMGSLVFFFATEAFRRRVLAEARPRSARPRLPSAEQFVRHLQDLVTRGLVSAGGRAGRRIDNKR